VAGLTVKAQEIGVVDKAAFNGDGVSSGLIGLAYPGLTSVYNSSAGASSTLQEKYLPFFFNAVSQKKVDPRQYI
jgi:hypothetical protein